MDWYVLLTPLLLLPIVSLLVFVGCGLEKTGALRSGPDYILVEVDYPAKTLAAMGVESFVCWCERTDPTNGTTTVTSDEFSATLWDVDPRAVRVTLKNSFLDNPPLHCVCKGKVTLKSKTPATVDDSKDTTFTTTNWPAFELSFWPAPTGTEQTSFYLQSKA